MKKAIDIILVLILIALIAWGSYAGYQRYQAWRTAREAKIESKELRLLESLNDNQEAIMKLYTKIAVVEKRIVAGTLKEETIIEDDAPTYNELKEELIELRKDGETNKEEIEILRKEYEERMKEYRESKDKILVNTGEEKIVIYEDDQGNLVSLDSGVKITRHREAKEVIEDLRAGITIEKEEENHELSFNAIYDINDKGIYPGISYKLWDWRKFSLNITGYNYEEIKGGLDICYNLSNNIIVGAGMNLLEIKDFKINFDKYYLKAGIEFSF